MSPKIFPLKFTNTRSIDTFASNKSSLSVLFTLSIFTFRKRQCWIKMLSSLSFSPYERPLRFRMLTPYVFYKQRQIFIPYIPKPLSPRMMSRRPLRPSYVLCTYRITPTLTSTLVVTKILSSPRVTTPSRFIPV